MIYIIICLVLTLWLLCAQIGIHIVIHNRLTSKLTALNILMYYLLGPVVLLIVVILVLDEKVVWKEDE